MVFCLQGYLHHGSIQWEVSTALFVNLPCAKWVMSALLVFVFLPPLIHILGILRKQGFCLAVLFWYQYKSSLFGNFCNTTLHVTRTFLFLGFSGPDTCCLVPHPHSRPCRQSANKGGCYYLKILSHAEELAPSTDVRISSSTSLNSF